MPNGHSGVSHPFGAAHGAGGIASGAEAADKSTEQSLADRMYADWHPEIPLKAGYGKVSDLVDQHGLSEHGDQPQYKPDPSARQRYYQMGVRPLDVGGAGEALYGRRFMLRAQHMEHMQFVGSDGSNFGMTKGGQLVSESPESLHRYQVDSYKFDADLIDQAKALVDVDWEETKKQWTKKHLSQGRGVEKPRYNIATNNCQDYMKKVLDKAQTLSTPQKPLMF